MIWNLIDGKVYIGSTKDLYSRLGDHFKGLFGNYHNNRHLQFAWNKYGAENFTYKIVQFTSIENLAKAEQAWMDWTKCCDDKHGYNFCPIARSPQGRKHTELAKAKMSAWHKQKKLSEDHKRNIALAGKRRINSEETRRKISINNIGKHFGNPRVKWMCPDGYYCYCVECRKRKAVDAKKNRLIRNARNAK